MHATPEMIRFSLTHRTQMMKAIPLGSYCQLYAINTSCTAAMRSTTPMGLALPGLGTGGLYACMVDACHPFGARGVVCARVCASYIGAIVALAEVSPRASRLGTYTAGMVMAIVAAAGLVCALAITAGEQTRVAVAEQDSGCGLLRCESGAAFGFGAFDHGDVDVRGFGGCCCWVFGCWNKNMISLLRNPRCMTGSLHSPKCV